MLSDDDLEKMLSQSTNPTREMIIALVTEVKRLKTVESALGKELAAIAIYNQEASNDSPTPPTDSH